jgi:hypothetical protein
MSTTATAAAAAAAATVSTTSPTLRTIEDLWTIRGQHYDLAKFIKRHPGGYEAIMMGKGLDDCTTLFESYHPFTNKPQAVLKKYLYTERVLPRNNDDGNSTYMNLINAKAKEHHGDISYSIKEADHVDPFFEWNKTPFYDDCKKVILEHFSPNGNENTDEIHRNIKATWSSWFQSLIGLILLVWSFQKFLSGSMPALTYFPLLYWIFGSDFMHNGSHFAMSTWPSVNKLSAYFGSFHVQYHLWATQHVIGHHVHTNIIHMDPDVHHFSHDRIEEHKIPGYRTHAGQKILKKYGWGWKFAVLFQTWATTFAIAFANTPKYLEDRAMETVKIRREWLSLIRNDRLILLFLCFCFVWTRESTTFGIWCLFWSWGIHGVLFNVFSQISHTNEASHAGTKRYKRVHNIKKLEWAMHQILTARDYSCDSWFWSLISINLNNQAMHHLFPSIHPCHYSAMRHKLIPVCAKHGVNYEERSSGDFFDAIARYFGWISKLNNNNINFVVESEMKTQFDDSHMKDAKKQDNYEEELLVKGEEGCVTDSSRVLIVSGTLVVCAVLAIPTMTVLWPNFQWAPLQAFAATLVPLIISIQFQDYDTL